MAGAVPRIRAVLGVLDQFAEKRRRQAIQVSARFTNNMTRHKFWRVFKHVNETVELAKDIVRDVLRRTRFPIQIDGDLFVAKTQLGNEGPQVSDGIGHVFGRIDIEFLVVNRHNEGAGPTLLLGKRAEITITGYPDHFDAFRNNGIGQSTDAKARCVFGPVVLVNDDDGKSKLHEPASLRGTIRSVAV